MGIDDYRNNNFLKKIFIMAPQTPNSQVISTFSVVGPSILPKIDMTNINIDPYLLTNILKNVKEHSGNRKMNPELNTTLARSHKTCVKRSRSFKENELAHKKRKVEENPVRFDEKSMLVKCKNCDISVSKNAYNQHLDWHFQMNMKNKKIARKTKKVVKTIRGYLEKSHWIISDEDENGDAYDRNSEIMPTVPALESDISYENESCPICREEFTQEFKHDDGDQDVEDTDQWHLVNAIRPDGPQALAYHPLCYEDKEIDAKDDKLATKFNNNLMQKANSMNDSFRNKTKFDSI